MMDKSDELQQDNDAIPLLLHLDDDGDFIGGGADAVTSQLTAGVIVIGPDSLSTTTGEEIIFDAKVNINAGFEGSYLAQFLFLSSGA